VINSLPLILSLFAVDPHWTYSEWNRFLGALRRVETGGAPADGVGTVGDNGKALGAFQIHSGYYKDACGYDKTLVLDGTYQKCLTNTEYSERVVRAYVRRYLPKNGTPEMAARMHNGGLYGYRKDCTLKYAEKFNKEFGEK